MYDSKAAIQLMQVLKNLCSSVKIVIANGGYREQLAENIRNSFIYILHFFFSGYKKKDSDRSKADG